MRDVFRRALDNYLDERDAGTRPATDVEAFAEAEPAHEDPDHEDELAIVPAGLVDDTATWLICPLDEAQLENPPRREAIDGEFGLVHRDALVDVEEKR